MSMPTIPDICPKICITKEDAVNLLLTSIALEEVGLADLIEAETKKIKFILGEDDYDEPSTKDILKINQSVNQTVKNIIKLQMLLQFKLENVMEIIGTETCSIPCTTTSSTTCTTTKTTTCTTTGCTTSKCAAPVCTPKSQNPCSQHGKEAEGRVTGCCHGGILNTIDTFFGGTALLDVDLQADSHGRVRNSIRYHAEKGRHMEGFTAVPDSIMVIHTGDKKDVYEICGIGMITRTDDGQMERTATGSFTLTVRTADKGQRIDSFQMNIISEKRRELNHDSGVVMIKAAAL